MVVGVCDDIPEYLNQLVRLTEVYFSKSVINPEIKAFSSGAELLAFKKEIDILFLDVELGDYNAIDLVKSFRAKYRNTLLIIVTSYEQYLDDALDLDILRYIDKPIQKERIYTALDRAIERLDKNRIYITDKNSEIHHINKRDIVYIESYLKQVYVYTENDVVITKTPMKELREKILSTSFLACPHNSYIVNLNYLDLYSRTRIVIGFGDKSVDIPVSSRHQTEFRKAYLKYMKEGYENV